MTVILSSDQVEKNSKGNCTFPFLHPSTSVHNSSLIFPKANARAIIFQKMMTSPHR